MTKSNRLLHQCNTNIKIHETANIYMDAEIALVISSKENAYGLERARIANIKAEYIKDQSLILSRLEEEGIDLIVLAGYLSIISEELINKNLLIVENDIIKLTKTGLDFGNYVFSYFV